MFTGSTATGRDLAEQCGRRLIGFSAELGGKNPMIVLADADLDATVDGAVRACFANAGQLCISVERIYVEHDVPTDFIAAFGERVRQHEARHRPRLQRRHGLPVPRTSSTVVRRHVDDAMAKGAKVIAGGKPGPTSARCSTSRPCSTDVTDEMECARNETFGRSCRSTRCADVDEAVEQANDTEYGLNASVWAGPAAGRGRSPRGCGRHGQRQRGLRRRVGQSLDAPMGGMKDSGVGRRHGRRGHPQVHRTADGRRPARHPVGPIPGLPLDRYA